MVKKKAEGSPCLASEAELCIPECRQAAEANLVEQVPTAHMPSEDTTGEGIPVDRLVPVPVSPDATVEPVTDHEGLRDLVARLSQLQPTS